MIAAVEMRRGWGGDIPVAMRFVATVLTKYAPNRLWTLAGWTPHFPSAAAVYPRTRPR